MFLTMARNPRDWRQPSLFPTDPADTPEPQHNATSKSERDYHALQDHRPRNAEGPEGTPRAATPDPQAPSSNGELRPRTEGPPRALEGNAGDGQSGQQPGPDRER